MLLASAEIGPFKSIDGPQTLRVEHDITVLVGMNEAGKTVLLRAMEKSRDALGIAKFDAVADYPRKNLSTYLKSHGTKPEQVAKLTYRLSDEEVASVKSELGVELPKGFQFSVTHKYDNKLEIGLFVDEAPVVRSIVATKDNLSPEASAALASVTTLRNMVAALKATKVTEGDNALLAEIEARIATTQWASAVAHDVYKKLAPGIPKFLYFGDYEVLPAKMNLTDLANRANNPSTLESKHRGVLALLRMADISVSDFANPGGYEPLKARIEGVSIRLTDQILEFWKQNEDLEVEVDIKPDPTDIPPFNNGPNLYLRIRNRRHRGVTTPFDQRSRGFIWFFSFLVWFESVQQQLAAAGTLEDRDLILLLDEPGLSLHALAQADFLHYIERLGKKHQVIYTTHSPFMVSSDHLNRVRIVEDRDKVGTVVSDNLQASNARTIFPLQAALGWTIAQNLFISERNLLVEGPSELIYFKAVSAELEAHGRVGLRSDVTIVPTGGLDKVATFVALLGASGLKLAVVHDYRGSADPALKDLARQKMISATSVLNVSQFRNLAALGTSTGPTDTEDLFEVPEYLRYFNIAYSRELAGRTINAADLPPGNRIIEQIERHLTNLGLQVRPSGGFNHYRVAAAVQSAPAAFDAATLSRFEAMFLAINALY